VVFVCVLLEGLGVSRVDCRDHRKIVLEFLEVVIAGCDGVVQRVDQRRVERTERKLVDVVREVECYVDWLVKRTCAWSFQECIPL
jgi:hypothetical protein